MKVRDLIRLLEDNGWRSRGTRGSDRQFKHLQSDRVVTVSGHAGKRSGFERKGESVVTYTVIYEHGPTSWGAYVPDLPGVIAVAASREEVETSIRGAIEFHLDGMQAEGLEIPKPSSFAGVVEIGPAAAECVGRYPFPFAGQTTPWSFFTTGPNPLYTNFCTRCPR
jgi:predicted RNase H-like HicB family nuclease/predicted RNA binding protein YcfA (HicA-like mRNA interferase family)